MNKKYLADYPHLEFKKCWKESATLRFQLGKCSALLEVLGDIPITPDVQGSLRTVAFERGAQATTQIEGNTLTDQELRILLAGKELPKSRAYQGVEVQNALDALDQIWQEVVFKKRKQLVSVEQICKWNKTVGKNLGPLYDGVPGRLRADRRHVGNYLAPPYEHVPELLQDLCNWLRDTFRFDKRKQTYDEAIIEAITAHVYFEWIHPFADGNGRTGRLLEFYTLLRGGFPDIAAHILANHYNQTRAEYSANFDVARKNRDLTTFIEYAVQGLVDGLEETIARVLMESSKIVWEAHVYRTFANYDQYNKITIFKRRRALALAMPIDKAFSPFDLIRSSGKLAELYMTRDKRMLNADMQVLMELELVIPVESEYHANIEPLLARHLPGKI